MGLNDLGFFCRKYWILETISFYADKIFTRMAYKVLQLAKGKALLGRCIVDMYSV